nr:MAG TPA: hypothetical protein [Caudoviricetes sp.]
MSNKKYLKYLIICVWSFVGFLLCLIYFCFNVKYVSNYFPIGWLSKDPIILFESYIFPLFFIFTFGATTFYCIIKMIALKETH